MRRVTNFSKNAKIPALPKHIEGHPIEAYKSEHGIVLTAPTHPQGATFLLLRGEAPAQVHGRLKRLLLDLARGRAAAEAGLKLSLAEVAKAYFGIE